ncbi:osmotically inducible protein C [Pseudoclavibacter sp. RFBG4]|uniref:OsmC family protein n=1 Tax=Pseudoclavibacter sp. RFBG4 TaxID=2080575 RepID=UPI000CE85F9B|nr:OsmC family protein [Pseudoclavibacter sp. RFBG4]PPG28600.1 osmotically inducible protein C [Pseudoclavibacter sp. RFBG4]
MSNTQKPGINAVALKETIAAVTDNRALGQLTISVSSVSTGGTTGKTSTGTTVQAGETDNSRAGKFTVHSDEPVALLGTDAALSPAEYISHALAGCYIVSLGAIAAQRGIELEKIDLDLDLDLDLAGFLGVDDSVRNGIQEIRVGVKIDAPGVSDATLAELVEVLEQTSVIRETLINPVKVVTTLA